MVKELADGSLLVGFFNCTEKFATVDYRWHYLGFSRAPQVRDLWLRKDLDRQQYFTAELPPQGCVLLKIGLNQFCFQTRTLGFKLFATSFKWLVEFAESIGIQFFLMIQVIRPLNLFPNPP